MVANPQLNDELETYRGQFEAIESEARTMVSGLTDVQLAWQPRHESWSICDCFDHLVVTGKQSLIHIGEALMKGRARGFFSDGPYRHAMLEGWFVWLMGPQPRFRFRAPRAYQPARKDRPQMIVDDFLRLQADLREALEQANGLDLARIKVRNPVSRWFQFGLGQEFAFTVAHERRHLLQISNLKANARFPVSNEPTA